MSAIVFDKKMNDEEGSVDSKTSLPVGYCVVIENSPPCYKKYLPVKRLNHILKERFHFNVLNFSSLSHSAVHILINTLSRIDHSGLSCLVVILIDSRTEEAPSATSIRSNEIINYFSEEQCPSLKNKPKVFLFQTVSAGNSKENNFDDKIKLSCIQPDATVASTYSDLPSVLDTLQSYTESCVTGSIFVNSTQTTEVTNSHLTQSFLLSIDHSSIMNNIKQCVIYELTMTLKLLVPVRETALKLLCENESLIIKACDDVYTSKVVGGTGGLAGTLFTVTGLALIPVTMGISLTLTGIGAGMGVAGGITAGIYSLASSIEGKAMLKDLKCVMDLDSQLCQIVEHSRMSLSSMSLSESEKEVFDDFLKSDGFVQSMELVDIVSKAYKQLNNKEFSAIDFLKKYHCERGNELDSLKHFVDKL